MSESLSVRSDENEGGEPNIFQSNKVMKRVTMSMPDSDSESRESESSSSSISYEDPVPVVQRLRNSDTLIEKIVVMGRFENVSNSGKS